MQSLTTALGPLALRRVYAAPPERVWRAWIDADALRIWFGQEGASGWKADWRVHAGGRYRLVMQDGEGRAWLACGAYREVVPNRRLVLTWSWRPADREATPADTEAVITMELSAVDGGTALDFRLDPMTDPRERDAWRADFKRLGMLLQTERPN
jgi:uncharacterized protein YndB with AHSA1/START domain